MDPDRYSFINDGDALYKGVEIEARTVPFYNFSLAANYTHVDMDSDVKGHGRHSIANVVLEYNNPQIVFVQLYGHYVRWGKILSPPSWNGKDGNVLWDLNLRKTLLRKGKTDLELFGTVHNLTDGSQYTANDFHTQPRWFETGIRVHF